MALKIKNEALNSNFIIERSYTFKEMIKVVIFRYLIFAWLLITYALLFLLYTGIENFIKFYQSSFSITSLPHPIILTIALIIISALIYGLSYNFYRLSIVIFGKNLLIINHDYLRNEYQIRGRSLLTKKYTKSQIQSIKCQKDAVIPNIYNVYIHFSEEGKKPSSIFGRTLNQNEANSIMELLDKKEYPISFA